MIENFFMALTVLTITITALILPEVVEQYFKRINKRRVNFKILSINKKTNE